MGAELLSGQHPALQFLDELASGDWPDDMPGDVAEQHDHYLADPRGE